MTYKIYTANMAKAMNEPEMGIRPVVVIAIRGNKAIVHKITSRNRNNRFHARMNNYIISGFCDIGHTYTIDTKYLLKYRRDCTTSEISAIDNRKRNL